jgi:hypothetical protein
MSITKLTPQVIVVRDMGLGPELKSGRTTPAGWAPDRKPEDAA